VLLFFLRVAREQAMRLAACLGVLAFIFCGGAQAVEGDPVAGKRKTVTCNACHGVSGFKSMPKLGGQSATYLVQALRAYKAGNRPHNTMRDVAGALSEKDFADLAAHYGAMPRLPSAAGEEPPAGAERCAACHGARGDEPVTPDVAVIAGQSAVYIEQVVREYRDGVRPHAVMQEQTRTLGDADISALALYFSRQGALSVK
jgi:cytochrome c553